MNKKLIFTDIDGTLVDRDMKISAADKEAISREINLGNKVYLATGRKYSAAKLIAQQLHPEVRIVASNGSVYDYAGEIFKSHFDWEALAEIFEITQEKNVSLFFFGLSETLYNKDLPDFFTNENQARLTSNLEKQFITLSNLDDLRENAEKIVNGIILSEHDAVALAEVKEELKTSGKLSISSSHVNNIELMPKGISKAFAIQALQDRYGISKENTIAFGDGLNDIEMFKCAKYSVAMGNASDAVKSHAEYQTSSNSESGISYFLNKLNNMM